MTEKEKVKVLREALVDARNALCPCCKNGDPVNKDGGLHIVTRGEFGTFPIKCKAQKARRVLKETES